MNQPSTKRPWTFWLFALQCVCLALVPLLIIAYRAEAVALKPGFLGSALLLLVVLALGVLAAMVWLWALVSKRPALKSSSQWAVVLGLLPLVFVVSTVGLKAFTVPPIHDITTDMQNPPLFVSALVERSEGDNAIEYNKEKLPAMQAEAYPEVRTVFIPKAKAEVYARAKSLIENRGWALQWEDEPSGHVEALVESKVFGFKDDVVLRLKAEGAGGTQVDMRSASRVGISDLGANAKRIQAFMAELAAF